jgi:hypothetical protein
MFVEFSNIVVLYLSVQKEYALNILAQLTFPS